MERKRKYNWRARSNSNLEAVHKNSELPSNVAVELELNIQTDKYDTCNSLLLSKKKKEKKQKIVEKKEKRPLTKKQRKHLEKIIERKKKSLNRSSLLEKLQKVQATSSELEKMTSTSAMQTCGLKKINSAMPENSISMKTVKGYKRRKVNSTAVNKAEHNPNIVGLSESESSSETDDSDQFNKTEEKDFILENSSHSHNTIDNTQLEDKKSSNAEKDLDLNSLQSCVKETNEANLNVDRDGKQAKETFSLEKSLSVPCEPAIFVPVERSPETQAVRESLPIYSEEQVIMEAIKENPVVVIHGATGSGKTTQVPQFLFEAGYARNNMVIGITEPRRIAAIQMASRVGEEMNLPHAVSYHIRYEKTATDDETRIKFMTDGVLLKEIQSDFLLLSYSVIIIDEAHERSVFSDVLIGLLSRILPLREKKGKPLKLVIMSATLQVADFTENRRLFKQKPFVITVDARQYDITLHFNIKTPDDYVQSAYEKVCKIHHQLPSGAILVFLTGEKEVKRLCHMLRKMFPLKKGKQFSKKENENVEEVYPKFISKKLQLKEQKKNALFDELPKIDLNDYSVEPLDNEYIQHEHSDDEENVDVSELSKIIPATEFEPLYVLPLYSVLPTEEQAKVFKPPPNGYRLCVVATNVAETSVTFPGLKYVVDSGKVKTRVYEKISGGISKFVITWTSKASANQRAGRAGRTEGGHCYRLYSSAVFEHDFPEFTVPDIQRIPVDDVVLQMKALGIDRVLNFPFPSPPDIDALKSAEKRLVMLGALHDLEKGQRFKDISKWEYSAKITPFGMAMSRFPLSPRYAKMLLLSYKHQVVQYIIAIVSAMTVSEVFLSYEEPNTQDDTTASTECSLQKIGVLKGKFLLLGDAMVLLKTVAAFEHSKNKTQFCIKYRVRKKAMLEIRKMRLQLIKQMNRSFCDLDLISDLKLELPTDNQIEILRKILTSGFADHIAKNMPIELQEEGKSVKNAYKCLELDEYVFIHPSSVLFKELPEFIIYQEIFQTSKFFVKNISVIEPEWLTALATSQCKFSAPLENPPPRYDADQDQILCSMTATFGSYNWELPNVIMPMPVSLTKYNYFCFFLLDGQICNSLNKYKKVLLSPSSIMLKQWARLLPRARFILQAVMDKEVDSKETLVKVWETNSQYLLKEYCSWIPEEKHVELACKWPPS